MPRPALPLYDLIIIGAGPSGLSCGIEAQKHKLSYIVLEKGGITDTVRRFPVNMTFFSTPELLELGAVPFSTPSLRPTRVEALQYYRKVVAFYKINIALHTCVKGISKEERHFIITTENGAKYRGRFVVFATGYFDKPNLLNIPGENLPHVSHYYTEAFIYAHTKVVVVGGRNSAVEAALDLYRHGAHVLLIHKEAKLGDSVKYWIKPDIENRIKEGSIKAYFETEVVEIKNKTIAVAFKEKGSTENLDADFVFLLTGYRPDESLLRQARVKVDEKSVIPDYDANTFETNIPGVFVAGILVSKVFAS